MSPPTSERWWKRPGGTSGFRLRCSWRTKATRHMTLPIRHPMKAAESQPSAAPIDGARTNRAAAAVTIERAEQIEAPAAFSCPHRGQDAPSDCRDGEADRDVDEEHAAPSDGVDAARRRQRARRRNRPTP